MGEFADSLSVGLEVLLDQGGSGGADGGGGADLSLLQERGTFDVVGEDSSGFSDDGGGLLVLLSFLLENLSFLGSHGVQIIDVLLVSLDLLLFGALDSLKDGLLRVEGSLQLGFELDSLGVALGDFLVVSLDVDVAGILEGSVALVVNFLFSDVSVFQIVEGAEESVQRIAGFDLQCDCVQNGLSDGSGIDSLDL